MQPMAQQLSKSACTGPLLSKVLDVECCVGFVCVGLGCTGQALTPIQNPRHHASNALHCQAMSGSMQPLHHQLNEQVAEAAHPLR